MDKFAEIRPYTDDEVEAVISRVLADDECIDAVLRLKFSRLPKLVRNLLKPFARKSIQKEMANVQTVRDFQDKIEPYLAHMIDTTVSRFSVSGIENLNPKQAYLFVSNHRDITLDPAFVNYALHQNGRDTVRIAIGDNLLSKPFVTDLMRINKSFIVKRNEKAPRKLLAALKQLSQYIYHSINEDQHSVWIAQREGRAKNGIDKTDAAILKMFAIHAGRKADFAEVMRELNIVPVSISYEYDPCDQSKAAELYAIEHEGGYQKAEQEDIASIAAGIAGFKGKVHLSFAKPVEAAFATAEDLAEFLDKEIIQHYVLQPSNFFAYYALNNVWPELGFGADDGIFVSENFAKEQRQFQKRIAAMPEHLQNYVLNAYANPIVSRLRFSVDQASL